MIALILIGVSEVAAINYHSIQYTRTEIKEYPYVVQFSLNRLRKTRWCGPFKSFEMASSPNLILFPVDVLREFVDGGRNEFYRHRTGLGS